jgi:hypothetical protein
MTFLNFLELIFFFILWSILGLMNVAIQDVQDKDQDQSAEAEVDLNQNASKFKYEF